MPLSTQRKVALSFGAAALTLGVIALSVVASVRSLVRSSEWVAHTHEVIETLGRVQQRLSEAETSERGYVLTGDTTALLAYHGNVARARRELDALTTLTADDSSQQQRIPTLRSVVGYKLSFDEVIVARRRAGDEEGARGLVRTGQGIRLMRVIERQIDDMVRHEQALLVERRNDVTDQQLRTGMVLFAGLLVTLVIAGLSNLMIRRDLRERDRLQRELHGALRRAEAASDAKSDFLARMSHELRTPLNSVIGFANVLRKNRRGALGAQELDYLDRIQANGQHLLGIINDILDLSKVEAGRMELHVEPVDLTALVRDTAAELGQRATRAWLEIRVDAPASTQPLVTDPAKLRQVLVNLLGNAAKFSEGRPVVLRIVADAAGAPLRLDVIDHGIGIPTDRLGAIFDAFEQAESSTTRHFGGTGLGLAISRQLCNLLGFRLAVVSESGLGSTFSVCFRTDAVSPARHVPVVDGIAQRRLSSR